MTRRNRLLQLSLIAVLPIAILPIACGPSPSSQPAAPAKVEVPPVLDRTLLFGNPDRTQVRLSPDGRWLSFLAPVDGVLNVWVAPAGDVAAAKAVTRDTHRGISSHFWAYDNGHVLYAQDKDGDENWHVYSADIESLEVKDLTPVAPGARASLQEVSHRRPNEILVGLNDRDPRLSDLYQIDLASGARTLVQKNDGGFLAFVTDDDYRVRFGQRQTPDGGTELLRPDGKGGWESFIVFGMEDAWSSGPLDFDKTGDVLRLIDSRERNTAALVEVDLATGQQKVVFEDPRADFSDAIVHPTERTIQAAASNYDRKRWKVLDPAIAPDLEYLATVSGGDVEVVSRTLDDSQWIVAYLLSNQPTHYYRYDRAARQASFLFTSLEKLKDAPLATMRPEVIKARDGLDLVSYLTLPIEADADGNGRPEQPVPMVLLVHGGPWARSDWGFDSQHLWLANRGYAVLDVNFRSSTGLGKDLLNAGNLEWGKKMHDDLLDAVEWAVAQGIAPRDKVAIMGGSYGGYATLAGLTFTPETFACGVDIVGPSNLITLLESIPPYWQPMVELFTRRMGDFRTEEGRTLLAERSPINFVEKIQRPLLIGQGANDPRVKRQESDSIAEAMKAKNIPVTYVLFPDEGHGFQRPENRLAFYAVAEGFLAQCLGGRQQPIGDDLEGSSIEVLEGAAGVPGLTEAVAARSAATEPAPEAGK
ncbi:MAG: S9 family peptidase [Thermoanaerobaculia bacterium]|nr:S9 family peptidase [Thermoanaerobaculia bacterium]